MTSGEKKHGNFEKKKKSDWKSKKEANASNDNSKQQEVRGGYTNRFRRPFHSFRGRGSNYTNNQSGLEKEDPRKERSFQRGNGRQRYVARGGIRKPREDANKLANVQCLKCGGFGNLTKECPNKTGIAMAGMEDANDWEEYETEASENEEQSKDLN